MNFLRRHVFAAILFFYSFQSHVMYLWLHWGDSLGFSSDFVSLVVPVETPNQPANFTCCGSDSDKMWTFERKAEIFPM